MKANRFLKRVLAGFVLLAAAFTVNAADLGSAKSAGAIGELPIGLYDLELQFRAEG